MQYTSLPSYIYLSPRRETRAEGCYCINIGKVKTRVMWRTRSSERGTQERTLNAKLVLWYAIQPVCANNTGAEWETMMTCQGLMRRGNISLVKRQRKSKRERAVEMWFEMYAQTKWKKKKNTEVIIWQKYRLVSLEISGNDLQIQLRSNPHCWFATIIQNTQNNCNNKLITALWIQNKQYKYRQLCLTI